VRSYFWLFAEPHLLHLLSVLESSVVQVNCNPGGPPGITSNRLEKTPRLLVRFRICQRSLQTSQQWVEMTQIYVSRHSLSKARYRKRKPKEEWTATGVITVVVITVVVIITSVIAPASRVVIAASSAVGVAPASAVVTSPRVVISSVRLARDHPDAYQ
jgi:hypothetical protein